MFFAPIANLVLGAVRNEEEGQASGANNAIRELGGVFGVAVLASVFSHFGGYTSGGAFVDGMNPAVWIGAGVVAVGSLAAFLIRRTPKATAVMPLEPVPPNYPGEVAERWRYRDGTGEVGVIASVSEPFCGDCTRARLSADGQLYTCLFAVAGHDLRPMIRGGESDDELAAFIGRVWAVRDDRYSELRTEATVELPKVEMFALGG